MSASKISTLFQTNRDELLTGWLREQAAALAARPDLINESQQRTESVQFLSTLGEAVKAGEVTDIRSPIFQPVLDQLAEVSRNRTLKGFRPAETAAFIFSLKRPLFTALKAAHGSDAAGLADDVWTATALLDNLGLHTSEVYQQTREDVINRQQEEMLELSTPVVQLWTGIVALPLIGTLDSARTNVVMETLLQSIVETRSEIAIIDITGVPTVDTLVAQHLLKTVAAARLMGADCIISGIRPQIAQTMVHLQIDLSAVTTKATMAEALRVAMKRTGFVVGRAKNSEMASASTQA